MGLSLVGGTSKVEHGDIAAFDNPTLLTYMFWGWHAAAFGSPVDSEILTKGASQFYCYCPSSVANAPGCGVSGASEIRAPAATWPTSTWVHLAYTYDSGATPRLHIYVDGVDQTLTGTQPTFGDGGAATLGFTKRDALTAASVTIAHFKAWSAVLTAAEILQERNALRLLRHANKLIWSPYDDGTSTRDYSGSGNHGTVTGGPTQVQGPPVGYGAPLQVL